MSKHVCAYICVLKLVGNSGFAKDVSVKIHRYSSRNHCYQIEAVHWDFVAVYTDSQLRGYEKMWPGLLKDFS
jgi:hypothetical protein